MQKPFFKYHYLFEIFPYPPKIIKGLMTDATHFIYFVFFHYTFLIIHSVQYIHPSSYAEASLRFLHCFFTQREKPSCSTGPRFELGPAL
jgi:hypothetical protein